MSSKLNRRVYVYLTLLISAAALLVMYAAWQHDLKQDHDTSVPVEGIGKSSSMVDSSETVCDEPLEESAPDGSRDTGTRSTRFTHLTVTAGVPPYHVNGAPLGNATVAVYRGTRALLDVDAGELAQKPSELHFPEGMDRGAVSQLSARLTLTWDDGITLETVFPLTLSIRFLPGEKPVATVEYPSVNIDYTIRDETGLALDEGYSLRVVGFRHDDDPYDNYTRWSVRMALGDQSSGSLTLPTGKKLDFEFSASFLDSPFFHDPLFDRQVSQLAWNWQDSNEAASRRSRTIEIADLGGKSVSLPAKVSVVDVGLRMKLTDRPFQECSVGIVHGTEHFLAQRSLMVSKPIEWINLRRDAGVDNILMPVPSYHYEQLARFVEEDGAIRHTRATRVYKDLGYPRSFVPVMQDSSRYFVMHRGSSLLLPPVNEGGRDGELRTFSLPALSARAPSVTISVPAGYSTDGLIFASEIIVRGDEQKPPKLTADESVRRRLKGDFSHLPDLPISRGSRWLDLRTVPADGVVRLTGLPQDAEWWPVGLFKSVKPKWDEVDCYAAPAGNIELAADCALSLRRLAERLHPKLGDIKLHASGVCLDFFPARGLPASAGDSLSFDYVSKPQELGDE